jgi:integrase
MKLNEKAVAALELPAGKSELILFDDDLPGFGIRLRAGGKRTWIIQYRVGRKQRRKTLGAVTPKMNVARARDAADMDLARVRLGEDPQAIKVEQRAKAADTFDVFVVQFLARQQKRLKARSYVQVAAHLSKHWKLFSGVSIHEITKRAIASRLGKIEDERGPIAANRARATLSSFFAWAIAKGIVDGNPVVGTHKEDEKSRERVLGDDELVDIWKACRDDDHGRIVRLLLLTACRRDEIGCMLKAELSLPARMLSVGQERTKNKRTHDVPLSDSAIGIIEQALAQESRDSHVAIFGEGARPKGSIDRGFGGWSRAKREIDQRIDQARKASGRGPIAPWVIHDLRRTAAWS